jgi:uncharacterized protein DUF3987
MTRPAVDDLIATGLGAQGFAALPRAEFTPTLAPEAYHGLAGRIVRTIEPHSEADPAALLLHVLIGVGSLIGRGPYATVEQTRHFLNEYVVLVGLSGKGRKGQAWSTPKALLGEVDSAWLKARVRSGLSSGEGVIEHVRDAREEQQPIKERGRVVGYESVMVDAGEPDKRLLVFEAEFASVLRRMNGETNSLSAVLRQAWDDGDLSTLTRKSPMRATGAHVSIIAHVTREELVANLTETERANGFANRFLFAWVRRSKILPEGGSLDRSLLGQLARELGGAIGFARAVGEIRRDEAARAIWKEVYPKLSAGEPGLLGAVLARAEPHVLRFSVLYAVLDQSPDVRPEHLRAALALWDYSEASARRIFGDRFGLSAVRARGGLTQTEISSLFQRNKPSSEILAALTLLEEGGKLRRQTRIPADGYGRPPAVWEEATAE